ncbi:MAG: hypothetical protein NTZ43_06875 [Gemmatimonadetes bacterium]|nr:hypothetical protein [Gemmatimonadota bacterium]
MTHIDVGSVLRHSANVPYADLVTRTTGAAVRKCIERELSELHDGDVAFLDFSHIGMMDYSCADEVVAKLLMSPMSRHRDHGYVVFHGITDAHLEAIEDVLHHHGLALVVHFADGGARLVGAVNADERFVWEMVYAQGNSVATLLAEVAGREIEAMTQLLDVLYRRRLLRFDGASYSAPSLAQS